MKGTRAKKFEQEALAAGSQIKPPEGAREGPPRPGPVVQASENGTNGTNGYVQIPRDALTRLCAQLRTSELLGPTAADALEALVASGRATSSPEGKAAKELRSKVANGRELSDEGSPKRDGSRTGSTCSSPSPRSRKAMSFSKDVPEEIPQESERKETAAHAYEHDMETIESHVQKDAPEPPELSLTPKQNHMRTDLEMWVMDEIPMVFGVDDSEELDEELQEDGQALQITLLIAEEREDAQQKLLDDWLAKAPDPDRKEEFVGEILGKVGKIQALAPKKKKKKKGRLRCMRLQRVRAECSFHQTRPRCSCWW